MDPQAISNLTQVLKEALTCVSVRRDRGGPISVDHYRAALQHCRQNYNPAMLLEIGLCDPEISDPHVQQRALDSVKAVLSEFIDNDTIQSATIAFGSGVVPGVPIGDVLANILKRAIVDGIPAAVRALASCTSDRECSYRQFHLLTGIRAHREVQLFDGISLIPLPGSTAELPPYLPLTFGHGTGSSFMSKTLLSIEHAVSPIFLNPTKFGLHNSSRNSAFDMRVNSTDVPQFDLDAFCQALSLTCDRSIRSVMSWQCLLDYEVFDLRSPSGVGVYGHSGEFTEANFTNRVTLDAVLLDNAKALYHALTQLPSETRKKLEVPITRWTRSHAQNTLEDRMIDLGIALESLYLSDSDLNEITFKFSLRAAWHLGRDKSDRDQMVKKFKAIYRGRSTAVHRGTLPKRTRIAGKDITTTELVKEAQALCSKSIKSIINSGEFPDWDNVVLGT